MALDVDGEVAGLWEQEEIPPDAVLYMRIHKGWFNARGQFGRDVFADSGEGPGAGMSTNWDKYADADKTRNEANSAPEDNYVVAMRVSDVLKIAGLSVKHTPTPDNRAHVDVLGPKTAAVKRDLRSVCEIVRRPLDRTNLP